MRSQQRFLRILPLAMFLLTPLRPAAAGPPAAPWANQDIGSIATGGSADFDDATGTWTVKGTGDDIFNYADSFEFAYQPVTGDGSITAQFLNRSGGDGEWAKSGLMIRQNLSDAAPNVNYTMTPGHGLHMTFRRDQGEACGHAAEVGSSRGIQSKLYMRLQRAGNEIAGFYSTDGQLWTQAGFSPVALPSLGSDALFGLAVTSHWQGKTTTAQFGQVNVQPGLVSASGVLATAGDRSVQLQWHPMPTAAGFNIYRGPVDLSTGTLTLLNTTGPVTGTAYTDSSDGLVNGTQVRYVVAPLFNGSDGKPVEGPRVTLLATPIAAPSGWLGTSLNEGPRPTFAQLDSTTGEITLQAAGGDIWNTTEQGYFLGQLVTGDFQITVRALTKPNPNATTTARYGLMIREALDGPARRAMVALAPGAGLFFQSRRAAYGYADQDNNSTLSIDQVKVPMLLRLTRQGKTITAAYSMDDGATYLPVGDKLTFDEELPNAVYAGVFANSTDRFTATKAKVTTPTIESLSTRPASP